MQLKFLLGLLTAATAAVALPAADNQAADAVAAPADDVSVLAMREWQASGGCKTDWAGRCNAQCIGEAKQKGYKCKNIDSTISSNGGCVWGWNTCECTCFY